METEREEEKVAKVSKEKLAINDKYLQQLDDIKIRVPNGYRDVIKAFAVHQKYKNVNQLIIGLINEKMEQVNYPDRIPTGVKEIKSQIKESE